MNIIGTYPAEKKPAGYRQLTVSITVVDLADATGGIPLKATRAIISVESYGVRTTDDGTDPTTTVGMPYAANATIELISREQIDAFKAIRSEASDAVLNISYYKS